jgi:uncharacterized protein YaaN involved in tellurite resistance
MAREGLEGGSHPIPPDAAEEIDRLVGSFLAAMATSTPGSRSFQRRMTDVTSIGQREILAITQLSTGFVESPNRGLGRLFEETAPVGRSLLELRAAVEDLDPARHNLVHGRRRVADLLRRPEPLRRYLERYAESEERIREMVAVLREGRSQLERENADIHNEIRSLATLTESLRHYAHLAQRLDEAVEAAIVDVARSDPTRAQELGTDVLLPIRQRRQDILTHLAVSSQGLAGLSIIGKNNDRLIRAIQTAVTTTVAALRTAVLVAHALTSSRIVAGQLRSAAELTALADAGTAAGEGKIGVADIAQLQHAWDEVFAALDEIEDLRSSP